MNGLSNDKGGGPPYGQYHDGIDAVSRGWLSPVCALLKDKTFAWAVVIAVIVALTVIALKLVDSGALA